MPLLLRLLPMVNDCWPLLLPPLLQRQLLPGGQEQ